MKFLYLFKLYIFLLTSCILDMLKSIKKYYVEELKLALQMADLKKYMNPHTHMGNFGAVSKPYSHVFWIVR